MTTPTAADTAAQTPTLHLARWTVTSSSNANSRGAVVIASGDHQWEASADGNGPIDALFRAVDTALHDVLTGHPRLLAYDIHALGEGPGAEGRVTVAVAPPESASGPRGDGALPGRGDLDEHHRGLDRGVHRGDQRPPGRGALGGRRGGGRQPAPGEGQRVGCEGPPGGARRGRRQDRHDGVVQPVAIGRWGAHARGMIVRTG